jgi:hypothetical protein
MGLPLHTRAAALVASLSIAATVVITVAEIGHPPADGVGMIASLLNSVSSPGVLGDARDRTQVAQEEPLP